MRGTRLFDGVWQGYRENLDVVLEGGRVVGIEKCDVLPRRTRDADVPGSRTAEVVLSNQLDPRVVVAPDEVGCSVFGAVVNDDDFGVRVSLVQGRDDLSRKHF